MAEFERIKNILEETGLYSADSGSLLYAELSAYSAGLALCFDRLEEMKRECFVRNARSFGLEEREAMFSRLNLESTERRRREALINAMSVTPLDFTKSGLEKLRDSFSAHGQFTYDPSTGTIVFHCTDNITAAQQNRLLTQMESMMPLWANFEIEYENSP